MNKKIKVFLTGKDKMNWALNDDMNLTKQALELFCDFVNTPEEAEVIHSVYWLELLDEISLELLKTKFVIAHISHDMRIFLQQKKFHDIVPHIDQLIVPSLLAKNLAQQSGFEITHVQYIIDSNKFFKINKNNEQINKIIKQYHIPKNKYLIGSFQRDTEGHDLASPKLVKGPDIFLAIVKKVYEKNKNIHIILAGPRRFWIKKQLEKFHIPYTHIGDNINNKDDIMTNTLSHDKINLLYNIIDLYIVSSRMEGGPKAILETAMTKCKIISTNVGQASDVLNKNCTYDDPIKGAELVLKDIVQNQLSNFTKEHNNTAKNNHNFKIISSKWQELYTNKESKKNKHKIIFKQKPISKKNHSIIYKILGSPKLNISILHKFYKPPWGGGNQFLLALSKECQKRKVNIFNNTKKNIDGIIFNSFTFDFKSLNNFKKKNTVSIHRVDGPTFLIRGTDKKLDDKVFKLNNELADITVFQSFWSYTNTINAGYKPINPIIIQNAVDGEIFNHENRINFEKDRKIRLISTSWSDNIRKGYETYKWIEDNLDWNRFDYTFVGNSPKPFKKINHIKPQSSEKLAKILKQHDIYITASQKDPCSNALLEALACGLPALYLNDGGHPELVEYGGLGFNHNYEILLQLDEIVNNYKMFQNLITIKTINKVTKEYLSLF